MDPDLETPQQALALAARGEIRTGLLEVAKHGPEEFLGKLCVALLVRIGEAVLGWRGDAETQEDGGFEPQPVADIVESHGMGELGEEHRRKMAHDAEAAGFGLHAGFEGVAVDQSARNEVEHLFEDDHIGPGWCGFVHNTLPSGRDFNSTPARFFTLS